MMGCGHHSAPVQEDLDDLVVVSVGREDQRGDVGGEGGRVSVQGLPAPQLSLLVDGLLVIKQHLHRLDVLLVDGVKEGVLCLDLVLEQQLDHLEILIVDAHEERCPAQGVDAIDIDAISRALQHPEHLQSFPRTKAIPFLFLWELINRYRELWKDKCLDLK